MIGRSRNLRPLRTIYHVVRLKLCGLQTSNPTGRKEMGVVTYDQANLLLRLYELRREPRLREARAWFLPNFDAQSPEEVAQKFPPGSEGNTNMRMVIGYWDMAAGVANRGLIDDDLFFENSGEGFWVWDRIRATLAGHAGGPPKSDTCGVSLMRLASVWRRGRRNARRGTSPPCGRCGR